jgi:hypothetical protein
VFRSRPDRPGPSLKHVERLPSFAAEGHRYAVGDGRQFFVFTGPVDPAWSACAVDPDRRFGPFVVRAATTRQACVDQLAERLAGPS